MPRFSSTPAYRRHTPTGQAVVTVRLPDGGRRDVYLGWYGSAASRAEYNRIIGLLAANGGTYPAHTADLSLSELILAYLRHAEGFYLDAAGNPSPTVDRLKVTLRALRKLYGSAPAAEFGPKALKAVRESWVREGLSRKVINGRVGSVKRMFRWAVSEELVAPAVYDALCAVEGLRAGRTTAPDRPPVRPAVTADVEAALAFMPAPVRALALVQLHSGARAGELVKLRAGDIDRSDRAAWTYTPASLKGTWRGKGRVIYLGKRCQEVLAPLILQAGGPDEFVFSPARSEASRNAERSEARQTPRYASHMTRNVVKRVGAARRRPPGGAYTTNTYRRAIERACERAGVPVFTPHRLRHLAATRTREELGVDVARALLGHTLAAVTEIYSHEVDRQLALKAVEKFG